MEAPRVSDLETFAAKRCEAQGRMIMKFSNGCWLNAEGTMVFGPAEVFDFEIKEDAVRLLCPSAKVLTRGSARRAGARARRPRRMAWAARALT